MLDSGSSLESIISGSPHCYTPWDCDEEKNPHTSMKKLKTLTLLIKKNKKM